MGTNNLSAASVPIQHVGADLLKAAVVQLLSANSAQPSSRQASGSQITRPVIQVPGFPPPVPLPSLVKHTGLAGLPSGYTVNHLRYQATHAKIVSTAYAGQGAQVILVEVRMVRMPFEKIKQWLIGVSRSIYSTQLSPQFIITPLGPFPSYR